MKCCSNLILLACLLLGSTYVVAGNNGCFVAKITEYRQDDVNKKLTVTETGSDAALRFKIDLPKLSALMSGDAWPLPDDTQLFPTTMASAKGWKSMFKVPFTGNADFAAGDVLVKFHARPEMPNNDTYTIDFDVKYALKANNAVGAEVVVKEDVKYVYQAKTHQLLSMQGRARDPRGWYQTYTLTPCTE